MSCGVDEAGRGPVIGPMVIAGVCGDRDKLIKIGVRDSKKLTKKRREKLEKEIKKIADKIVIRIVEPEEIDILRKNMSLNEIEVIVFSEVIRELRCREVYVDAADVNEDRFGEEIKKRVGNIKIISKHRGDSLFPEVSAASIIAKVERDRRIKKLQEELGDFGSGYPSDLRTVKFLEKYYREHDKLPPHTRKSWKTVKRMDKKQKKLESY